MMWMVLSVAAMPAGDASKVVRFPLSSMRRGPWRPQLAVEPVALAGVPKASNASEIRRYLQNDFDLFYLLDLEVGTPKRNARVVVDTGSADLWVDKQHYNAADSSTALVPNSDTTTLNYGQGMVSGVQVKDRVCLGQFCVPQQSILEAATVDGIGNNGFFEGVLGLAFPGLEKETGNTFLQEIQASHMFRHLAFGLALRHDSDAEGSFVCFGNLNDVLENANQGGGALSKVTLPVLGWAAALPMFWFVRSSISFGGAQVSGGRSILGALDSGTSLIAMPKDDYDWVLESFFGTRVSACSTSGTQLTCPCNIKVTPMTLTFVGSDNDAFSVELTAKDLLEPLDEAGDCRFGIQPGPVFMNFWILGDAFLRRVYVVHDPVGYKVVMFAQQSSLLDVGEESLRFRPSGTAALTALMAIFAVAMVSLSLFCCLWVRRSPSATMDSYNLL